jgi:tellurite resistance protein
MWGLLGDQETRCYNKEILLLLSMDIQSAGAILRILNMIAMADGHLSLDEQNLLDSLVQQYKLQTNDMAGEETSDNALNITGLAQKIDVNYHYLTFKTATMVAIISKGDNDSSSVCSGEEKLLSELAGALSLSFDIIAKAQKEASQEVQKQPTLLQVLCFCFGSQFERSLFV